MGMFVMNVQNVLNLILVYTSGNSFCYTVWYHLVNWTITFSVIGLFTSTIIFITHLVNAICEYLASYILQRAVFQLVYCCAWTFFCCTAGIDWAVHTTKSDVSKCKNQDHKTHAFDLNGAISTYLALMLFIFYALDSFLKYKDLKYIKLQIQNEQIKALADTGRQAKIMSSTSQAAPSTSQLVVKNEGIQTGNIKTVQSGQNERLELKDI